jgi:two-component system, NarL family, invasion response regulator UvrY
MRIRVLLVDDHEIVRRGLSMVLQGESDIEIVGEAGSGSSAIEMARKLRPDVILMDVSMPGVSGAEATQVIHGEFPDIRVIGLSVFDDTRVIARMVAAGAAAYVTKGGDPSALLAAVRGAATSADRA